MKLKQFIERIIWGPEEESRASPPAESWTPPGPDESFGVFPYSLGGVPGGASFGSGVFQMQFRYGPMIGIPIGVREPETARTYPKLYDGAIATALGDYVPYETVREWVPPRTIFLPFSYPLSWEELRRVSGARRRGLTKEEREKLTDWGGATFFSTIRGVELTHGEYASDRWTREKTHKATAEILGRWNAHLKFATVPDTPEEFGGIGLPHTDKESGLLLFDAWGFGYALRWEMVSDLILTPVQHLNDRGIAVVANACSSWGFAHYPGNYYNPTKTTDNQTKGTA